MNVIPTAAAPTAAPATTATAAPTDGTDARLADAFAALVDALTAQVDQEGAECTEGEATDVAGPPAEPTENAEDAAVTEASAPGLAPTFLVWPTHRTAAPIGGHGPVSETATEGLAPQPLGEHAPAGDLLAGDVAIEAVAADVALPGTEAPPASGDDAEPTPELVDEAPGVEGQAEPVPADATGPESLPAEAGPVTAATRSSIGSDVGDGAPAPAVGVSGSPPARPAGEVAATAQATTTRTAAPTLPDQLVEVIGPLRQAPDGTHRVSVQLRPDELGEVLVDVRVRGNEVSLSIRADLAGTADLLRDAVGELRAELEAAGFRSGDVDVSANHDRRTAPDERRAGPPAADDDGPSSADLPGEAPTTSAASSGLDVRL